MSPTQRLPDHLAFRCGCGGVAALTSAWWGVYVECDRHGLTILSETEPLFRPVTVRPAA